MDAVIEVVGCNGDSVVLAGPDTGKDGMWLATEVEGLMDPEAEIVKKEAGNRAGSRFISHRILERTLIFNVSIENGVGEGNSWRERDSRWRALWAYDRDSQIKVTTEYGTRTLTCRLTEIEVDTYFDPATNEATDVTMTVTAYDPFWYGDEFVADAEVAVGATYEFMISDANPTSNPVFPQLVLEGGAIWEVQDGERFVKLPELSEGEDVLVNTDPSSRQLTSATETMVWGRMNGVRFREYIAPRTGATTLALKLVSAPDTRSAQLRLKRPFDRPWG